jgi:hypothetical protein
VILYTPLSQSDIFPPSDEGFKNRECISYDGKMMLADKNLDGSYQMVQLLSTDPQDFLKFSPGSILN